MGPSRTCGFGIHKCNNSCNVGQGGRRLGRAGSRRARRAGRWAGGVGSRRGDTSHHALVDLWCLDPAKSRAANNNGSPYDPQLMSPSRAVCLHVCKHHVYAGSLCTREYVACTEALAI